MRRPLLAVATALLTLALLSPAAMAEQSGEGLIQANDKNVVEVNFIVIAFFPAIILLLSIVQWRLDKRKEARKARREGADGLAGLAGRLVGGPAARRRRTRRPTVGRPRLNRSQRRGLASPASGNEPGRRAPSSSVVPHAPDSSPGRASFPGA
jgi:hypothetical protein